MLQYFETLTDDSGNSLLGATCTVTNYPSGTLAGIYSSNGTAAPIANSTVAADITGQVSFYIPDGAYTLTYSYKSTVYKTKSPVQMLDPMGFVYGSDSGSANAYLVNSSAYPASLYAGLRLTFKAANASTGAATMNLNSTGAKAITYPGGSALAAAQIQANGIYQLEYDGTEWQILLTQTAPIIAQTAQETAAGVTPTNLTYAVGNILRYGADPTGSSDSTPAIQAALNVFYQSPIGGTITIPSGVYNHTGFNVNGTGIQIIGSGYNAFHDGGTFAYPCKLNYTGGAGGTMVSFFTTNPTVNAMFSGNALKYIYLEGNGVAGTGLAVTSMRDSDFDHVYVKNTTVQAYKLSALARAGATEATDLFGCTFSRCTWRNTDTAAVQNAHGFVITTPTPGGNNANPSFNTFELCDGECTNGTPYILADCDNNEFFGCRGVRTAGNPIVSIRGADTNYFYDLSVGGGAGSIEIRGTASGYYANPVSNVFFNLDDSNGTGLPTLDANCRAQVHFAVGGWYRPWQTQTVISDAMATAETEVFNLTNESLRVRNNAADHMILTDGTNTWGINIDGSGNLRLVLLAGSGAFDISAATTGTAPAAGGAQALPATPAGYFTQQLNGVSHKVAYY